jgi:hypothetical protein
MAARTTDALFHEEQPFDRRRVGLALAALPLLLTAAAAARLLAPRWTARLPISAGDLIFFAVLLWIVYAWLVRVRLVVDVTSDGLAVGLRGLIWRERIAAGRWTRASIVSFEAGREFGGYGLRRTGRLRTYIAGGSTGVRVDLADGDALIIGSARERDLLAALERAGRGDATPRRTSRQGDHARPASLHRSAAAHDLAL